MDNESNYNIKEIVKGTVIAICITIILLAIFAAILTYTNINENTMPTVVIIITAFSILIGSQITTSEIHKNGLINGALVGLIYMLFLYLISSIITKNFTLNIYSIIMIASSIIIGAIGGIIGVNIKK